MDDRELRNLFDRMASGYDGKSDKIAPIYNGLYFLLESVFAGLPQDARLLCVGVGTGTEVLHLASVFPGWSFIAVEPSGAMLDICRRRVDEAGFSLRCRFHEGYLDSLPDDQSHDGATCFLVSQFILDAGARSDFFRQLAARLVPGGVMANADLSYDTESAEYDELLAVWQRATTGTFDKADRERMKSGYAKDVSILPSREVISVIESAGFDRPVPFFQAALIRAWFAKRVIGSGR